MSSIYSEQSLPSTSTQASTIIRSIAVTSNQIDAIVQTLVIRLQLDVYKSLNSNGKVKHLDQFDALELYTALQNISNALMFTKVENFVLEDFFRKNDPKMLKGYERVRASFSRMGLELSSITRSTSCDERLSIRYHVKYRTKIELTEKLCSEIEKSSKKNRISGMREIRILNAIVIDLDITTQEAEEAQRKFQQIIDKSNISFKHAEKEKVLLDILKKFTNNWFNKANSLILGIRLRRNTIEEGCFAKSHELQLKEALAPSTTQNDFELLVVRRNRYRRIYKERRVNITEIKNMSGLVNRVMNQEREALISVREDKMSSDAKLNDIRNAIEKFKVELIAQTNLYNKDIRNITKLREKLEHFDAPSVAQYVEVKHDLILAEKEEKMVERKINIAVMKLKNLSHEIMTRYKITKA
ncbi:uncharacterized protein LOC119662678 [Teleopsis dalmanni]|uniref:uncharacterized protein LOC119662678 n=1 Tax=Teleopsis dalmanni TaxID=139649 RepID=UPI0018CEC2A9|nr:uncharacterized protein LOC119662678 [Teleopsis dalmanni]